MMLKNIGSNWLATVFAIILAFVLTPFMIHALGQERYGAWILISSLTGYLTMLALGIPMATVRFVAKASASGDQERVNRTVSTCAVMYLVLGIASMLVGAALFFIWDRAYDIPTALRSEARWAFALVVLNMSASFVAQLPYGIMSAHHDFVTRNRILIASGVIRLGLTYLLLSLRVTMVWLAVIQITCFLFEFSVATTLIRSRYRAIRLRFSDFDRSLAREILGFSAFVLILQAGGQLVFESDSLVIGKFLPLSEIPYFTVSSSLAVYLMSFVISIAAVVMPMAAALQAQNNFAQLREIYLKWSKITIWLSTFSCVSLIVLGPRFLSWWVGPGFERPAGEVLQILMAANIAFLPARGVALPILMGLGKPRHPTTAFFITALVNLVLSIVLVQPWGLNGVAIGTAIPNVVFAGIVVHMASRELQVPVGEYLRYAVVRPLIGIVPVVAFLIWLRDGLEVRGLVQLAAAGVATCGVAVAISLLYVMRGDPRVGMEAWLGARWKRMRA
jgi:O-antigen/teichoic acid export membrane protein